MSGGHENEVIQVLVAEDSPTTATLLTRMLESDPAIRVIGTVKNGEDAVRQTLRLQPDLITMDIGMPVMDGLEATRRIMNERPTPILVVTGLREQASTVAFDAIAAGALDVIEKPLIQGSDDLETLRDRLVTSAKLMAVVKVVRRKSKSAPQMAAAPASGSRRTLSLVAFGASTGGPAALKSVFKSLPGSLPVPAVVVQHVSRGFLPRLVKWLQQETSRPMRIAVDGDTMRPGVTYFAPEEHHLRLRRRNVLELSDSPPVSSVRPSATVLFNSVASVYQSEAIGVLLTGMGNDGAEGLQAIRAQGGVTLAQDKETSVVYGMPRVAADLGVVDHMLPLEAIGPTITRLVSKR